MEASMSTQIKSCKMAEVKLLAAWPSPFSYRVIWALKLKGIPFEHVEENITFKLLTKYMEENHANKSTLLLQSNPVYKKIPVLLHGGKPVCESMNIVEYIDEIWPQEPLFPSDPFERATARFWVKFIEDQGSNIWIMFRSTGEEQEKATKEVVRTLSTIEEQALGDKKFFNGDKIGIVDIAYGFIAHWLEVIEEVLGLKLLEADSFPKLHAWTLNFKNEPVIEDNLPERQKMLAFFKNRRELILATT